MKYLVFRNKSLGLILFAAAFAISCMDDQGVKSSAPSAPRSTPVPVTTKPKVVAYGDSLTSGFGLAPGEKPYPALLQERLDAEGYDVQVLNYGFPGDTTERGLARLYLATGVVNTRIFVLELGANDIMKGVPADSIRTNLSQMIERLKERDAEVILCGFVAPSLKGTDYGDQIDAMYRGLAASNGLVLVPDFMEGVSGNSDLMQADGIHPNELGVRVIEERVYKVLVPYLKKYEIKSK